MTTDTILSPGPYQWGIYEADKALEMIEGNLKCGSGPVHLVFLPKHERSVIGDDPMRPEHAVVFCITGNGPNSENNARALVRLLSDYQSDVAYFRSELARVKEAAELLARECVAWRTEDDGHKNDVPLSVTMDMMLFARKQSVRTDANPTAAALVDQARKEKV